MNPDLQNKILLALFGVSGPVAKWLSIQFHLDNATIELVLNVLMLVTPSVAGWVMAQMATIANKMAHIREMEPADQVRIASAIPASALVTAASNVIGARVVVDHTASPAVQAVAANVDVPDVIAKEDYRP